jgi:hypothetical protein
VLDEHNTAIAMSPTDAVHRVKQLTGNQMFVSRQTTNQRPPPKAVPIYISCYINEYRRPWTTSDVNPKMGHAHGQIAGPDGVLLPTTEQKAFLRNMWLWGRSILSASGKPNRQAATKLVGRSSETTPDGVENAPMNQNRNGILIAVTLARKGRRRS